MGIAQICSHHWFCQWCGGRHIGARAFRIDKVYQEKILVAQLLEPFSYVVCMVRNREDLLIRQGRIVRNALLHCFFFSQEMLLILVRLCINLVGIVAIAECERVYLDFAFVPVEHLHIMREHGTNQDRQILWLDHCFC